MLVLAIAVFPLVMLVGFQSAWAYACRIDGTVRDRCCCATDDQRREAASDPQVRIESRCCCDVSIRELDRAPAAREIARDATFVVPEIPSSATALALPMPQHGSVVTPASARPPPPALSFLEKRAILR